MNPQEPNKSRSFTCAGCGDSYKTSTTQEEKESEFEQLYGHKMKESSQAVVYGAFEEVVSVCDHCFSLILIQKEGEKTE